MEAGTLRRDATTILSSFLCVRASPCKEGKINMPQAQCLYPSVGGPAQLLQSASIFLDVGT